MERTVLILMLVLLFNGCAKKETSAPEPSKEEVAMEGEQKIMSFSLVGYKEGGKKKWEVEGKSADVMADVVNLTEVEAKTYGEEANVTLVADRGTFNRTSSDVHLESNVVATSTEGTTLTTDVLNWKNDEERVYTDKFVKVTRENMETTSTGAEARPNLKEVEFKKDVKVVTGKPQTVITCDGPMEVNYGKNFAVFDNKVKVEDERGQLYCDKATAYYEPKMRQIIKVVAQGNVKLVRGGSWTFSDEAVYLAKEEKVILTGSPKVVIYPEETKIP
ncbi:MAG: LPS export ABC transporter periplasmic protein LptC [Candidatus Omnitrophota bacterium]